MSQRQHEKTDINFVRRRKETNDHIIEMNYHMMVSFSHNLTMQHICCCRSYRFEWK